MDDFYIGDLTPGTFVINVNEEVEWGIGQVQSSIDNKITINFENVGKKTSLFFFLLFHAFLELLNSMLQLVLLLIF